MVIGNKGSVHYIIHQGEVVRVAACRLVAIGEAEEQIGSKTATHPQPDTENDTHGKEERGGEAVEDE